MMRGINCFYKFFTVLSFLGVYGLAAPQVWAKDQGPGLYWWGKIGYECYNSQDCGGIKKLKAFVGLPVTWKPKARCVGGKWNFKRVQVATGALPPGLRLDNKDHIVGVAQRAGTWYLRIKFTGVTCAGKFYGDKTQDLAITTEGSSAPRSVR
jgi:hypothetical protein